MFIDHNGKLAWTAGWYTESARPIRTRHLSVSDIRADEWTELIDPPLRVSQEVWSGNNGIIHVPGQRPVRVNTLDWEHTVETEPIKKPRRGKRQGQSYDWEWSNGRWVREWI